MREIDTHGHADVVPEAIGRADLDELHDPVPRIVLELDAAQAPGTESGEKPLWVATLRLPTTGAAVCFRHWYLKFGLTRTGPAHDHQVRNVMEAQALSASL